MKKTLLFMMGLLTSFFAMQAQDGTLDATFGNNGIVNMPGSTNQYEAAYAVAAQNDGKIVAVGIRLNFICIKRYNSNGTLDTSFGNQGEVVQSTGGGEIDNIYDVKIQPDGKIIVAGSADYVKFMFLARYNSNGTPDTGFGTNGIAIWDVYPNSTVLQEVAMNVFVLADGKIMLTGSTSDPGVTSYQPFVAKYNADGTPDFTFGSPGAILDSDIGYPEATACLPDGKIVYLLTEYINNNYVAVIKRYGITGEADTTFGPNGNGTVYISAGIDNYVCRAITVQPDGKIVAGGFGVTTPGAGDYSVVRLNYDGTQDTTFGVNGVIMHNATPGHDEIQQIIVQPDGKIVAAGIGIAGHSYTLARYNANGTVDTGFGTLGVISTSINNETHQVTGLAVQPDGKIITSNILYNTPEYSNFFLMRYLGSSSTAGIEEMANMDIAIYPNPTTTTLNISNPESIALDSVNIIDITGKNVLEQKSNLHQIDVQNLSPGMYFLELTSGNKQYRHKFIKQ